MEAGWKIAEQMHDGAPFLFYFLYSFIKSKSSSCILYFLSGFLKEPLIVVLG